MEEQIVPINAIFKTGIAVAFVNNIHARQL